MIQTTLLALLGLAVGLGVHLRWHPLRREFSDAWDFLRLRQPLVLLIAGLMLLAGEAESRTLNELQDWRSLWLPLLREVFTEVTLLFHGVIPPWPLALLLPLVLLVLTIRVWRWPYRYGERVPVPEQKLVLIGLTAGGLIWTGLEITRWRWEFPEFLESTKLAGRVAFTALTAAGMQVWLVRLVLSWERPTDTEADRDAVAAVESTFARWQSVAMLGGFNLLWMTWQSWRVSDQGPAAWLLPEFLMLFAALPPAVAVSSGKLAFWHCGAAALKALLRCLLPLAGFLITALAVMMLGRYTAGMAAALCPAEGWALPLVRGGCALALAMLHGWLCLTALFIMLRHGFQRPSPADPAR